MYIEIDRTYNTMQESNHLSTQSFTSNEYKSFLRDEGDHWNGVIDVDISYAVSNFLYTTLNVTVCSNFCFCYIGTNNITLINT